ncbi:unnamed protein product [Mesocestoides corti]|uniref:Pan3 C-terminal knob domain-containing protein n=1 Tax=Mesocestoides corti TaxID=53468 RepID=A0A0R3UEQ7_MESCO|nr:unnamed protein product [Mesocestoides corti]
MANFFQQGNSAPIIPPTRYNFNSHNLTNTECHDLTSLSISLANACLNSPYQNTDSTHRIGSRRSTSAYASAQAFQPPQPFNVGPWVDRSKLLGQLPDSSSGLDPKMFEDNLLKSTFISGRFPPRPADQSKSSGINQRSTFSNEITGFNGPQAPRPHKVPPRCVPCDGGGSFNPMLSSTPSSAIYAQAEISKGQPDYSQWLLNPAAPAVVADHLRTGRSNNLKSNLLTDRSSGVSYMDQALHQVLPISRLSTVPRSSPSEYVLNSFSDFLTCSIDRYSIKGIDFESGPYFPQTLGPYLLVNPLEGASTPRVSEALELPTQCFKAWSPRLSMPVVLRRVLPERLEPLPSEAYFLARQFCDASDPSVIQLRDVVPVDEFGDNSVIFVYDFLPCCYTLQQIHMSDPAKSSGELPPSDLLPERTAWMFLVQLTQALRFAHQTLNRSVGVLHPSKILVQDGTRLFVNCIGLKDVINHSTMANTMAELKARDFVALGKLMLGVIFGTPLAMKELENGRLFRLICKLNSVVERHDTRRLDHREPEWSETGDRYMLKLFRDFVFHQVDQRGAPHLDLAHIVTVLNKVEAASQERLCLVSRKGERAIIVTYADIRHWLDTSFGSLVEEHRRSLFEQQMVQQQEQQQADAENNGSGVNPTEAIYFATLIHVLIPDQILVSSINMCPRCPEIGLTPPTPKFLKNHGNGASHRSRSLGAILLLLPLLRPQSRLYSLHERQLP